MSQALPDIKPLLDHLALHQHTEEHEWHLWHIGTVTGFHSHPVYRATRDDADLAVKFVARGPRDGAGREYNSLLALQRSGFDIAPKPLLLDRDRYESPVVVMTWLDGEVRDEPPQREEEWLLLARHHATLQAITPATSEVPLRASLLSHQSARDAVERFRRQVEEIAPHARPAEIKELARYVEDLNLIEWPLPRLSLIRGDPNILNFVRRTGSWASVDWEDSGWGDPAAEMGDLMAHPSYISVPGSRWEWLATEYGKMLGDETAASRTRVYYVLTVAWWAALFAARLHRLAQGDKDSQYIGRPANWEHYLRVRYEKYAVRARELLSDLARNA
jgi:aminoglycoside phosphotransferase (APT) family kinase protein